VKSLSFRTLTASFIGVCLARTSLSAQIESTRSSLTDIEFQDASGRGDIKAVGSNVLRVRYAKTGVHSGPTSLLNPRPMAFGKFSSKNVPGSLSTDEFSCQVDGDNLRVNLQTGGSMTVDLRSLVKGDVEIDEPSMDHLYGIRGIVIDEDPAKASIYRDGAVHVTASVQGDGGAPLAFTTTWGVLVDSIDGNFLKTGTHLEFSGGSRKDVEFYLLVGPPKKTMAAVAALTGESPIPPKWSLGFMNSQWGLDENEVKRIVTGYRSRQIPIDAFILDFDYKAWGEDNYGEFRWNGTSGPGNVAPDKFPDGPSGKFGKEMLAQGIKLVGIMKPRVLVVNTKGAPTDAAKAGYAHQWFLPGQKPYREYFSNRLAQDIDFSTQPARNWFWSHAKGLFETGIDGWWNDEADYGFSSLGFFNMQRSLYDGQRSVANQRVWSINRNFYLGSQRYGFGTWSGDINTGFENMRLQATRMIADLDLGQAHWSMDTGGFNGHPSPENYARWMEFAALVPIMRVHGTLGEKRQPWVYGPIAEAAAKSAIELRSRLQPTLYDLESRAHHEGVGIVRPMFWEFPEDPKCAGITDEWMLGTSLLAAPVFEQGATERRVYLPQGTWFKWDGDQEYSGGADVVLPIDSTSWKDIPLFVRAGSIVVTQPVSQYVGDVPVQQVQLDIWPDAKGNATGEFYDDDGENYNYEKGHFFLQKFSFSIVNGKPTLATLKPVGDYKSTVKTYKVVVHGSASGPVRSASYIMPASAEGIVSQQD
jgi:alpha-glucosidase (family GH31 glycosyl hydrolase)